MIIQTSTLVLTLKIYIHLKRDAVWKVIKGTKILAEITKYNPRTKHDVENRQTQQRT